MRAVTQGGGASKNGIFEVLFPANTPLTRSGSYTTRLDVCSDGWLAACAYAPGVSDFPARAVCDTNTGVDPTTESYTIADEGYLSFRAASSLDKDVEYYTRYDIIVIYKEREV